jgi:hypothetical protein
MFNRRTLLGLIPAGLCSFLLPKLTFGKTELPVKEPNLGKLKNVTLTWHLEQVFELGQLSIFENVHYKESLTFEYEKGLETFISNEGVDYKNDPFPLPQSMIDEGKFEYPEPINMEYWMDILSTRRDDDVILAFGKPFKLYSTGIYQEVEKVKLV